MADMKEMYDKIDFSANNFDSTNAEDQYLAQKFANKYGLTKEDLIDFRSSPSDDVRVRNVKRAKVIDKVAEQSMGYDPGWSPIGPVERFQIKNFIDEDPNLQVNFLKRRGYDARINENGELEAREPGKLYTVVDPSRFEISDIFDVAGDLITEGIMGGVTGVRALTGPMGWLATAPIGGSVAGGLEYGKQGLSRMLGLRNNVDATRIAEKAALGAVLPLLPRVFGEIPGKMAQNYHFEPKPNVGELQAAGKRMGATPTMGMLNKNVRGQEIESALFQSRPASDFNADIINKIEGNIDATDQYAASLFQNRSGMSKVDAGREIQPSIVKKLQAKKDTSEKIYNDLEGKLHRNAFKVNVDPLDRNLDSFDRDFMFDKTGRGWVMDLREELTKVKSIGHLRKFNRRLGYDVERYAVSDPPLSRAAAVMASESKALIDKTFSDLIELKAADYARTSPERAAEFTKYIDGLRNDLKTANRLYREVNVESGGILKTPETASTVRGSAQSKIDKISGRDFQKIWTDVYSGGNLKKANWLEKTYPEEFNLARNTRLEQVWNDAITKRPNSKESLGSNLSRRINSLTDTEKEILFGKDGIAKARDLATWFANKPITIGPSGTPQGMELLKGTTNYVGQGLNAFRYWLSSQSKGSTAVRGTFKTFNKAINNPATRGGANWAGKQIFVPKGAQPEENQQ